MNLNIRIHRDITGEMWFGSEGKPSPNFLVSTSIYYNPNFFYTAYKKNKKTGIYGIIQQERG